MDIYGFGVTTVEHGSYHFEERRNEEVASISMQWRNAQQHQMMSFRMTTRLECPSQASISSTVDA